MLSSVLEVRTGQRTSVKMTRTGDEKVVKAISSHGINIHDERKAIV